VAGENRGVASDMELRALHRGQYLEDHLMFHLPIYQSGDSDRRRPQPYSRQTLDKHSRTRGATVTHSICCYCAVGCSTLIYSKAGQVIDIEGDPRSPINEGTLCPKGANLFQLHHNPHRVKKVLYRAPYSDRWELKSVDWALDRIAQLVKKTRDDDFRQKDEKGRLLNHVTTFGTLGGATLDNEENYLIKKLFGAALGAISIENQARI
jgi:formate dehydrogenase major subunit